MFGSVHAAFSLYWGVGGDWLTNTVGTTITSTFDPMRWVLVPIGLLKLAAAWFPLTRFARHRTAPWLIGLMATVLTLWGGLNTVFCHLVLASVIVPADGYDRVAMMGHAWLWDPLFLVWGLAFFAGLFTARTEG